MWSWARASAIGPKPPTRIALCGTDRGSFPPFVPNASIESLIQFVEYRMAARTPGIDGRYNKSLKIPEQLTIEIEDGKTVRSKRLAALDNGNGHD
jgi:hypothetical protein